MTTPRFDDKERMRRPSGHLMRRVPPPVESPDSPPRRAHGLGHALGSAAVVVGALVLVAGILTTALELNARGVTPRAVSAAAQAPTASITPQPVGQAAAVVAAPCAAGSGLGLKQAGTVSDMDGTYEVWVVTDSGTACSVAGFPVIQALNAAGSVMTDVEASHATVAAASAADVSMNVGPSGAGASFYIYTPYCSSPTSQSPPNKATAPTPATYTLQITLTGMATPVTEGRALDPTCSSQSVIVSPLTQGVVVPPGFTTGGSPPAQPLPSEPPKPSLTPVPAA
jgi:hypothetical protein